MKRLFVATFLLCGSLFPAQAKDTQQKPEDLTMTLAWIVDGGQPNQYVFVINGHIAYKTIDGLKHHLERLPKDSKLTWSPGCDRFGDEPLLGSEEEMKKFKKFCESIGINFVLVPSG